MHAISTFCRTSSCNLKSADLCIAITCKRFPDISICQVLLEGIPQNAQPDDVERFLSGCEFDASSIQMFVRLAWHSMSKQDSDTCNFFLCSYTESSKLPLQASKP